MHLVFFYCTFDSDTTCIMLYNLIFNLVPPAPKDINIRNINASSSWHITWSSTNPNPQTWNITGYIVFYKEESDPLLSYQGLPTAYTNVTLSGLKVGTRYICHIVAYNNLGNGIPSNAFEFGTTMEVFEGIINKLLVCEKNYLF